MKKRILLLVMSIILTAASIAMPFGSARANGNYEAVYSTSIDKSKNGYINEYNYQDSIESVSFGHDSLTQYFILSGLKSNIYISDMLNKYYYYFTNFRISLFLGSYVFYYDIPSVILFFASRAVLLPSGSFLEDVSLFPHIPEFEFTIDSNHEAYSYLGSLFNGEGFSIRLDFDLRTDDNFYLINGQNFSLLPMGSEEEENLVYSSFTMDFYFRIKFKSTSIIDVGTFSVHNPNSHFRDEDYLFGNGNTKYSIQAGDKSPVQFKINNSSNINNKIGYYSLVSYDFIRDLSYTNYFTSSLAQQNVSYDFLRSYPLQYGMDFEGIGFYDKYSSIINRPGISGKDWAAPYKDVKAWDIVGHLHNFLLYVVYEFPITSPIFKIVHSLFSFSSLVTDNFVAFAGLGTMFVLIAGIFALRVIIKGVS